MGEFVGRKLYVGLDCEWFKTRMSKSFDKLFYNCCSVTDNREKKAAIRYGAYQPISRSDGSNLGSLLLFSFILPLLNLWKFGTYWKLYFLLMAKANKTFMCGRRGEIGEDNKEKVDGPRSRIWLWGKTDCLLMSIKYFNV